MELRHLRYFVAVSEEKSFVHAAQRLRVAQPALSRQIRDLEAEVGVTLFERLPRGVRLTPAGEAFLADAHAALVSAARAVDNARGAAERRTSMLQFAHGELAGYHVMIERLLAAYRAAHPRAQVQVTSQGDGETFDALRAGRVDVACVFTAEWPVPGFGAHRLIDCAVTGGSEACISFGTMRGWEAMRVMAPEVCRPFSIGREGMMIGEGAACLVLEPLERAQKRGAQILGEVVGFGMSADAADLTAPDPDFVVVSLDDVKRINPTVGKIIR